MRFMIFMGIRKDKLKYMFNDIKIGPVTFHMYGLMIAIGFAAALMMCLKRGKKHGLNEDIIYGIFFCAIFGGMIGCRLLYYIVEIPEILKDPSILWNFKNGYVVYGRETDSWFSITFTHSDFAPNGVKLLPTQLMSSAGDFLICGLLLLYAGRKPKEGQVAAGYMVLYGIGRFIIEFFRNDYRGSIGVLSTSQIISIGVVAAGVVFYLVMNFRNCKGVTP